MNKQKTIALFGATGATGNEFLKLALKQNYIVKALVRTPEKIKITDANLTLIKGDLSNEEAISKVVENTDNIVCMVSSLKSPQKYLMFNFIKILHPIMLKNRVTKLTYQAGALCYPPNKKKSVKVALMRNTVGKLTRVETSIADHDKVMQYIQHNMLSDNLNVFVTLPGGLGLTVGESKEELNVYEKIVLKSSRFIDVAYFTLQNMNNSTFFGRYLYVA
jgi:prephenate dehydrogenase